MIAKRQGSEVFRGRKNEAGSSIVEMLVVATIGLIFVAAAINLFNHATNRFRTTLAKNDLEEIKETLGSLIRPDFETVGYGISGFENHAYGTGAALFQTNGEYDAIGNGEIVRSSEGTSALTSLTKINSETGSVTVTVAGESRIDLIGAASGFFSMQIDSPESRTPNAYRLFIQAGDERSSLGFHYSGTTYRISLVPDRGGKAVVLTRLASPSGETGTQDTEIYRTGTAVPFGAVTISAFIRNVNQRMQIQMKGAPLVTTGASRALQSNLFIDAQTGTEVTSPIYENPAAQTVTLISGNQSIGVRYLEETVANLDASTRISVSSSEKEKSQTNDYCLLIDYTQNKSALLQINRVDEDEFGKTTYEVSPVTANNPAWNRFYSSAERLSGSYPAGSRLVKLHEPLTYRISSDGRLIRQVGEKAETAAFNCRGFEFQAIQGVAGPRFEIAVAIAGNNRQTQMGSQIPVMRYVYTATPPALNAANQSE